MIRSRQCGWLIQIKPLEVLCSYVASSTIPEVAVTYKTILVHCDASKSVASRLDVAVGLAQRFNAHLIALDARPPFQPPAFVEGGMDLVPDDYEENVKAGQTAAVAAFAKAIEGKEIASDWRAVDASADSTLIAHAR